MSYVSIVIPTKNAGQRFQKTLEGIYSQETPFDFEVIVVDSGSTDGTLDVCHQFPATCVTIPPDEFNHGETRNYAIRNTQGTFIALTVQDALPANTQWLAPLVTTLEADSNLAGAYSRQIACPDVPFAIKRQIELWHRTQARQPVRYIEDMIAFEQMCLDDKRLLCAFDNVSAAIRRDVWKEVPFPKLPFGEDLAWSLSVMRKGFGIAYVPESKVIHSHFRPFGYNLRRAYADRGLLLSLMGESKSTSLLHLSMASVRVMGMFLQDAARQKEFILRNVFHGLGFYVANFLGTLLASARMHKLQQGDHSESWNRLDSKLTKGL